MYNLIDGVRTTASRGVKSSACALRKRPASMLIPMIAGALLTTGGAALAAKTPKVHLGAAGKYVILSETGITDVYPSRVTGSVGVSPITGAADLLSCSEVTGKILSVDAAGPAPCSKDKAATLGKAIAAMQIAYTDAASRTPTVTELGSGNIGGLVIPPGVYSWSSSVSIPANVTLSGGPKDVWIFQVAQDVNSASATSVLLSGGALPQNVFWQVAGSVNLGTYSQFEGVILSMTAISMATSATINGALYAQTAVSLQMNNVVQPTTAK